jgi:hypothetical protein
MVFSFKRFVWNFGMSKRPADPEEEDPLFVGVLLGF